MSNLRLHLVPSTFFSVNNKLVMRKVTTYFSLRVMDASIVYFDIVLRPGMCVFSTQCFWHCLWFTIMQKKRGIFCMASHRSSHHSSHVLFSKEKIVIHIFVV